MDGLTELAESELARMGISRAALSHIRSKDGAHLWRLASSEGGGVLKLFDRPEHRREIANYGILAAVGVPTLRLLACTERAIVMEDIESERSAYRLGEERDLEDPEVARLVARWYKNLHENGRQYAKLGKLYDESDCLTLENIGYVKERLALGEKRARRAWEILEGGFGTMLAVVADLPRTLTYNDFYWTNLAVAKDGKSAIMFDYNMLGKGYAYSDARNVLSSLGNNAREVFLDEYGPYSQAQRAVDDVASPLVTLHFACRRDGLLPEWAEESVEILRDGRMEGYLERLLCWRKEPGSG